MRGVLLRAALGEDSAIIELERENVAWRNDDRRLAIRPISIGQTVDSRRHVPPVEGRETESRSENVVEAGKVGKAGRAALREHELAIGI